VVGKRGPVSCSRNSLRGRAKEFPLDFYENIHGIETVI
jgi:hypothetical protein